MSAKTCRYFDGCSAPVCPDDPDSLANCAWFADEDICRRGDHASTPMVKAQKRIARVTARDFERGCFTVAMLTHPCERGKGIKGLDPEQEITPQRVRKWISDHPPAKPMSEERREASRKALERARASLKGSAKGTPDASGGPEYKPADTFEALDVKSHHLEAGGR